jgi:hypothetical protein
MNTGAQHGHKRNGMTLEVVTKFVFFSLLLTWFSGTAEAISFVQNITKQYFLSLIFSSCLLKGEVAVDVRHLVRGI